ncbi:hypothetical protein EON83_24000 [bacterium]|nr:MAG: hypothetical protein EON83_24000 [bacterium]
MSRRTLIAFSPLALLACGCSPNSSSPSSTQFQRTAAQALVNNTTGNARRSRDNARDLRDEADKLLAAQNYDGAMDKRLQILAQRSRGVSLLSTLSAYATQGLAIADIETVASHLDAASCRTYAEQLKSIDTQKPTFSAILEANKDDELDELDRITRTPREWQETVDDLKFSAQERATLRPLSPAQLETNISNAYATLGKWAEQPYSSTPPTISGDPYTQKFSLPPMLPLSRFLWTKAKAERLLTIVALQQRADRLESKPRTWTLPTDPFGTGPFKEKSGVIYSIGPDATDDGGKSVPQPKRIQISDTGDILAPTF